MLHIIIGFILVQNSMASYCANNVVPYCSTFTHFCTNYYEFYYNTSTMKIIVSPAQCAQTSPFCSPGQSCEPPCSPKIGGPNGKVCNDFTTQSDCQKFYANNGADKWCWWGLQSSGGYFCYEGITCHD